MSTISTPVSYGELIDKITILEIKSARIADPAKRANVQRELQALTEVRDTQGGATPAALVAELRQVNEQLWEIEDLIRDREAAQQFDARFVALARSVYTTNDERAAIKKRINIALGSRIIEEKAYKKVHNILHYIIKNDPLGPYPDDPQSDPNYSTWEESVQKWAAEIGFDQSDPPTEYDTTIYNSDISDTTDPVNLDQ